MTVDMTMIATLTDWLWSYVLIIALLAVGATLHSGHARCAGALFHSDVQRLTWQSPNGYVSRY